MKRLRHSLIAGAILLASSVLFAQSTPEAAPPPPAPRPMAGDAGAHAMILGEQGSTGAPKSRFFARHMGPGPQEMENVTFLGVETETVSPTLVAQLNLPDNAGLVVRHVVPESAAAGVLQPHDILLKLDDQILIDQHQLAVLIRNHKDGDQVTLTYMRGGKSATASVKLTKHQVPKFSDVLYPPSHILPLPDGERIEVGTTAAGEKRADTQRVLTLIQRAHNGEPVHMQIDPLNGAGLRGIRVNTGNSNLVYSDEKGSLELTLKDGKKTLVAKDPKGGQQFAGAVTTPEERKAMPADVRQRLEKLEAMQDVTFQTDGDFEGAETRILPPSGQPMMFRKTLIRSDDARPNQL